MNESFIKMLSQASVFSSLIPVLVGMLFYVFLYDREEKVMLFFLVSVGAIVEFFSIFILFMEVYNSNLALLHGYTILEFYLLVSLFSCKTIAIISKKWRNLLTGGFVLCALGNIYINGINQFNTDIRAIESIVLIALSLLFFYNVLKNLKVESLEREPMFWISAAILIYFSGNLITFILSNYALSSTDMSYTLWAIHAFLNILKNLLFAVALWVKPIKQENFLSF